MQNKRKTLYIPIPMYFTFIANLELCDSVQFTCMLNSNGEIKTMCGYIFK